MLEPLATVTLCCKHPQTSIKNQLNGSIQMNHGSKNMRKCTLDLEYGCCVLVAGCCSTSGSQLLLCHQSLKLKLVEF